MCRFMVHCVLSPPLGSLRHVHLKWTCCPETSRCIPCNMQELYALPAAVFGSALPHPTLLTFSFTLPPHCPTSPPPKTHRYGPGPYGPRGPYGGPYGSYNRNPYSQSRGGRNIYYVLPDIETAFQGESAAPRGLPGPYRGGPPGPYGRGGGGGGGPLGGGGSPVGGLINIATNLLLQLPFSRCVCERGLVTEWEILRVSTASTHSEWCEGVDSTVYYTAHSMTVCWV